MAWSSFPVFPSDDGWPYPDLPRGFDDPAADDEVDLDALELRVDPTFSVAGPDRYARRSPVRFQRPPRQ